MPRPGRRQITNKARAFIAELAVRADRKVRSIRGTIALATLSRGSLLLVLFACAVSVNACSKTGHEPTSTGTRLDAAPVRGELRIAIHHAPNTLNPLFSTTTTEAMLNRLSFDTLVSVDAAGKQTVPILASEVPTTRNGGISKDGMTITYHLRSGVKWQDGFPFTSKDVKFSWQAVMNEANDVATRVGYEDVKAVDTPNDTTVVFHLKHKFAPFVNTVFGESDSQICIVPEHILGKYKDVNRVPFNEQPVGTGPFKVVRWVRGDHIELVANDEYFRGKPKLRRIVVREIPDENTSINALRSHNVDWIFEASQSLYKELRRLSGVKVVLDNAPLTGFVYVNTSRPELADIRIRRAISYAIDKQAIVKKNTDGTAVVAWADQPPFRWAHTDNIVKYPPDVQKAKDLLVEAGYTPGPDGIMRKGGQPLSLVLSYNVDNATRRNVAVQLQAMLRAVGIETQLKAYAMNLLLARYAQGGILATGKYDLDIAGAVTGTDPDDRNMFACDAIPRRSHPGGYNFSRYCSKDMEAAQEEALGSYDEPTRKHAYVKIQQLIARDLPIIYLWHARQLQPISATFKGFAPNPVCEAWNSYQWET